MLDLKSVGLFLLPGVSIRGTMLVLSCIIYERALLILQTRNAFNPDEYLVFLCELRRLFHSTLKYNSIYMTIQSYVKNEILRLMKNESSSDLAQARDSSRKFEIPSFFFFFFRHD